MFAAAHGEVAPVRRSSISDVFRQFLLESVDLRVVLLGNSWPERASVGNLLADDFVFDEETEPQRSVKQIVRLSKKNTITLINTADLLHPDLTDDRLSALVSEAAQAAEPGPHAFLLVLRPESFTERHRLWLRTALGKFSEQSFRHASVLLWPSRRTVLDRPHLRSLIAECGFRYQWVERSEEEEPNAFTRKVLFTRLAQIVKENSGEHLKYEQFEDTVTPPQTSNPNLGAKVKERITGLLETVKNTGLTGNQTSISRSHSEDCHCRVLLVGRSDDKKKTLLRFMSQKSTHPSSSKVEIGEWRGKLLKVVRSADVFSATVPEVMEDMRRCVRECHPGPNVLLLLVKPSEVTEKYRETLNFILSIFDPNVFKHTVVVFTHDEEESAGASQLRRDCEGRVYEMFKENRSHLMSVIEAVVERNHGSCIKLTSAFTGGTKMRLNLVFCGRQGSGKTSAAQAIVGETACCRARSPSNCTRRDGEVSRRPVSIVELPALAGKPQKEVMEECLSCVSMCEPDGVHAFVMVLPLRALTDEDKAEFKTVLDSFSSRISDCTLVLFTVESDPRSPAFTAFVNQHEDLQTLCRSCRGHVFFNVNDKAQVPEVVEEIERSRNWYTTEVFAKIQIERFTQTSTSSETSLVQSGRKSEKTLRIVLIGKTGRGKSTSGNTILGRKVFNCDYGQKATTKVCQKEQSKRKRCCVDVVDTPGLFDMSMSNHEINDEMMKCISLLAPGPHVFLLVLGIGRFTPEENETLNLIKKGFGKDAQKYTIVLFTHGDVLERNNTTIEDFIKDKCDPLCQKLISDCGNRYHVFNNWDESRKHVQVDELIQKIDALVEGNGGGCYTNKMLKEAEAAIQEEVQRLLKEKEEELRREMQEMRDKHEREIQEIQTKMDKEREKTEKEREDKDRELRQMKAQIRTDRKQWMKNQKKKEEDYRKEKQMEEDKRQEYERNIQELEENLQRSFDLKSQESKDKIQQERKAWEEERREREERYREEEKRWQEEQERLEKQEQEYKEKLETWTKERERDQRRREQEEATRKELEEKHNQQMDELKRKYEDEARKQAEEFNEFKKRKEIDFAALIDEHLEEVKRFKEDIKRKEGEYESLENLKTHNETSLKMNVEKLQSTHKQELIDLAIVALMEEKENSKKIREVQKKHKQELRTCEKAISDQFEKERKRKVGKLKKRQNLEMEDLEDSTKRDDLPLKKKELSENHKQQLKDLESELWNERKQQLKEKVDGIKKNHEAELNAITKSLLEKNKEYWEKRTAELEKKQLQEMDAFVKKAGGEVNEVELDRLKTKHQIEMDQIKKRMFLEEGWCSIL